MKFKCAPKLINDQFNKLNKFLSACKVSEHYCFYAVQLKNGFNFRFLKHIDEEDEAEHYRMVNAHVIADYRRLVVANSEIK